MVANTKSGKEWLRFSESVLRHIEDYAVPQYGDKGTDMAHEYDIQTLQNQIKKYVGRFDTNARGEQEQMRDVLKIAHYACILYDKLLATRRKSNAEQPSQTSVAQAQLCEGVLALAKLVAKTIQTSAELHKKVNCPYLRISQMCDQEDRCSLFRGRVCMGGDKCGFKEEA